MKKMINQYLFILLLAGGLFSCKKDDYKNDGGKLDPHVNMTTYDYLASKPVFSQLVHAIDKAGMKEMVNGDITFFATTNYGVDEYVLLKKRLKAIELNDENISYTLDSIPVKLLQDSLKLYMFRGKINREDMTYQGKLYNSMVGPIPNVQFLINLRKTFSYSDYIDHVDVVTLTKVIGSRDDMELNPDQIPQDQKDLGFDCQTSGIITTTGIVHVLNGYHRLFFNTQPIPQ